MTADEFLEWSLHQEDRYELVDGRAVLMAGANNEHDVIVVNLITALGTRLRGGPCRPSTADTAARMLRGNVRRPDVTVDCAPPVRGSAECHQPTVFFEVLSPSTRGQDLVRKAMENRLVPSLRHFVFIEPLRVSVQLWSRGDDDEWGEPADLESLDAILSLPAIDIALPLSTVYEGALLEG